MRAMKGRMMDSPGFAVKKDQSPTGAILKRYQIYLKINKLLQ